ncbi:MAG TPA: polyketide synthase PksJ, partial [Gammaproteobacteria bacterium]|nr:polyketide synthase PksJ [Gammaproteobacteria bacterium]
MKRENPLQGLSSGACDSFIDLCKRYPVEKRFIFHGEKNSSVFLSGEDLFDKVSGLGSALQKKVKPQEKVLIVFPQGLEYIYGLLSCFHANVIAIPVPVTDTTQIGILTDKITSLLKDCQATVLLTNTETRRSLEDSPVLHSVTMLDIDSLAQSETKEGREREKTPDDIALLFYTSGSTSQPKGVIVSHGSLMSQAKTAAGQWAVEQNSCIVSWMPQFHNFGLHLGVLAPLLKGASSVILPPGSFINSPGDWFGYVDQYQATHIAAPNFAFDYCCSLIDLSSVGDVSLKSLKAIISGGEANRKETHDNFMRKFRCLGLGENIFCPHYGLSEIGSVTTKSPGAPLRYLSLDIASLTQHKVKYSTSENNSKQVASCGALGEGLELRIADPDTGVICSAEDIGEIWLKSDSQYSGYINQDKGAETDCTAVLNNIKDGFIRTGDLGFVEDNHLYIVGREKEVMIIHGKNHHPVDMEWTIKNRVPQLTLASAVFSCDILNQERVIVVQETEQLDGDVQYAGLTREIFSAVSQVHEVTLYDVVLVKKGSIPKTSIGKIQRKLCRSAYLENNLTILYQYRNKASEKNEDSAPVDSAVTKSDLELVDILKREIFNPVLDVDTTLLEQASTFMELGVNSIQYVRISKKIEEVFNLLFQPVMLFKHSSFQELARYLSTQITAAKPQLQAEQHSDSQQTQKEHREYPEEVTPSFSYDDACNDDVAIIGMSCHFPGGSIDPDAFWENLVNGNDCITSVSHSRPQINDFFDKNYGEKSDSFPRWGGFIEDVDCFDPAFFNISPLEAESMDPQQRKALELTWSVIESSGYNPRQLAGSDVGLFIGAHNVDYAELVMAQPMLMDTYGAYLDSGLHMSMISNRVSRWFDFHGPSEVINTACSSSLVAIHHAVESLRQGDSCIAIAGGINLLLAPRIYLACHNAAMLSEDGRCKTFDEKANGFVRAEGYGAVLLKPYAQALRDNDVIFGVIKGVGINHDGHSNSLRAPNLKAQKQLVQSAYEESGVAPETINYIEAHGTGTSLGDPIEVQALSEAFQAINPDIADNFCGLGTVKTNIGHCESAAGIAGLIKVLLAMKHQTLPGVLHFADLNPYITLHKSPFHIVEQTQKWQRLKSPEGVEIPRRAGVSSFGFGGANAHLIVEEPPLPCQNEAIMAVGKPSPVLIIFSAHQQKPLLAYAEKFLGFIRKSLADSTHINLADIAYTLQVGREAMEERLAFWVQDIPALARKLEAFLQGEKEIEGCWKGRVRQESSSTLLFESDEDSKELIRQWTSKGKLEKIAQLWVQGCAIDWDTLHRPLKARRISLPTYPFARERYWIPEADDVLNVINQPATILHPLLHTNTSDLAGQ